VLRRATVDKARNTLFENSASDAKASSPKRKPPFAKSVIPERETRLIAYRSSIYYHLYSSPRGICRRVGHLLCFGFLWAAW
jgi:hypothetical protein